MAIIGLSQGTTPLVKRRDGAMFMSQEKSTIPCNRCNGDVYEFSVPNDIWNLTIRLDGREGDGEYICIECWFNALRKRLEQSEQVLDLLALYEEKRTVDGYFGRELDAMKHWRLDSLIGEFEASEVLEY